MHPNHPLLRASVHLYDNLLIFEGVEVINDNSGVLHFYDIPLLENLEVMHIHAIGTYLS